MPDEPQSEIDRITLLEPWTRTQEGSHLVAELNREATSALPLFGVQVQAIARCIHSDDVLFALTGTAHPFAVVHLTWSGKPDPYAGFPYTVFYNSLNDWVERCMKPDHEEYTRGR